MATPQLPRNDLAKWMREMESRLAAVEKKDPFINSGFAVKGPGVVECDNAFNVVGNETVSGTLNVTGNTVIGGTLSLPAGIINNDALANPVIPGVVNASATNFGLGSGAFADVVSASATVPSGCTRLLATAAGWIDCYNQKTTGGNNGSGGDYLYCKIKVGSTVGLRTATGVSGSNGQATAGSGYSALLTGLTPGSSVSLSTQGVSDYGIDPNIGNIAILSATLLWLR